MSLDAWIDAKAAGAARSLRRAVSATGLVHERPQFGWSVRPLPGSILASPRPGLWDPEPDYFHHWFRDAAIAIRPLPTLLAQEDGRWWRRAFRDHCRFTLRATDPDAPAMVANPLRPATPEHLHRYLRDDAELAGLTGSRRCGEPRVGADGGPDLERWNRPQYDGVALRAAINLALIETRPDLACPELERVLARDRACLMEVAGTPSIGPWEDPPAQRHSFTLIAMWDALDRLAVRLQRAGGQQAAAASAERATGLLALLEGALDPHEGGWLESVEAAPGQFDASAVLAILYAGRTAGPLALQHPRTHATVEALERRFRELYPLNGGRDTPAIGRWTEDTYFGGNPWYPTTLGFAELHYRQAALTGAVEPFAKAEAWMALLREVAPAGDALPEQFDRTTGSACGALELTWSAAAFLTTAAARAQAIASRR